MQQLLNIKDMLEALSYFATLVCVPAAALVFILDALRERQLRELETHERSNGLYIDYLDRCLEDPDLDAYEFRRDDKAVLESGVPYKRLIMFTMLISMMETAFIRYRLIRSKAQRTQWSGWESYMAEWAQREDFRAAWRILAPQFDTDFIAEMTTIVAREKIRLPSETNA